MPRVSSCALINTFFLCFSFLNTESNWGQRLDFFTVNRGNKWLNFYSKGQCMTCKKCQIDNSETQNPRLATELMLFRSSYRHEFRFFCQLEVAWYLWFLQKRTASSKEKREFITFCFIKKQTTCYTDKQPMYCLGKDT